VNIITKLHRETKMRRLMFAIILSFFIIEILIICSLLGTGRRNV